MVWCGVVWSGREWALTNAPVQFRLTSRLFPLLFSSLFVSRKWSRRGRGRSGDDEGVVVVVVVAATAARLSDSLSLSLKELADWEW